MLSPLPADLIGRAPRLARYDEPILLKPALQPERQQPSRQPYRPPRGPGEPPSHPPTPCSERDLRARFNPSGVRGPNPSGVRGPVLIPPCIRPFHLRQARLGCAGSPYDSGSTFRAASAAFF